MKAIRKSWSIPPEVKVQILRERKNGMKIKDLAKKFKLSPYGIGNILYKDSRRKAVKTYYLKHKEETKERMRDYFKKYSQRPKFKAKVRARWQALKADPVKHAAYLKKARVYWEKRMARKKLKSNDRKTNWTTPGC